MLKRLMHKRERHFAFLNDNRIVHPFGWGVEFIKENANGDDPRKFFREYTKQVLANSAEFFFAPNVKDYKIQNLSLDSRLSTLDLSWTSGIEKPLLLFCRIGTPKPEVILICARFLNGSECRLCA
jgi:hypothetical protein